MLCQTSRILALNANTITRVRTQTHTRANTYANARTQPPYTHTHNVHKPFFYKCLVLTACTAVSSPCSDTCV